MTFSNQIKFGFPEEWMFFHKRHHKLTEKLQSLFGTLNKTFIREMEEPGQADKVIFFLGRVAVEDFMEILLLCANGYGIGAMKLLRGLYERAVNLGYIAKHPDKADKFLDYHHVHVGRHFNHADRIICMKKYLSAEQITEIQNNYNITKEKYKEVICSKCNTTRIRLSWSELDILSMACQVGLDKLYLKCYYEPTLQSHATTFSITHRLISQDDNAFTFNSGAQHDIVDDSLIGAHHLILYIIFTVNEYFKLGLDNEIQDRFSDFLLIWKEKK